MPHHSSGTSESSASLSRYDIHQKIALVNCINDYALILTRLIGADLLKKRGNYFLIMEICKRFYQDNPVTIKEAYRAMQQEGPTAGARIDALENAGYLMRNQHPRDGRKRVLYPTDKLRELFHLITSEGIETILRCADRIQKEGCKDTNVTVPLPDAINASQSEHI